MEILVADVLQNLRAQVVAEVLLRQDAGDDAQICHIQRAAAADRRQASGRQREHLAHRVRVHPADDLKARLHDLLEALPAARHAVHALGIADLGGIRAVLGVFDDGKRHVRLERHELAVHIRKRQHVFARQKALVAHVQVVFLKLVDLVRQVAAALVHLPQLDGNPLIRPQIMHLSLRLSSSDSESAGIRPIRN